jgi:hypothetical protein
LFIVTRREADQVFYLPGVTFDAGSKFQQHSGKDAERYVRILYFLGYLKGKDGHFLHYWLMKSQSNPNSDPLG